MDSLSLCVLGSFQASLGNKPLPGFRTHKVQALLLYLAVEPGPQRRESLMALLWPGLPDRSARGNLRQIIYLLRKVVPEVAPTDRGANEGQDQGPVPLLLANRQTLQLNPAADIIIDAKQFEEQFERINNHDHLDLPTCLTCRSDLEQAVQLYGGNFLEDFYLDDSNEFED
jgi:DNA-binding SARP family transcriptional activator